MNRKVPVRFGSGEKAEIRSKPYLSVFKGRAPVVRFGAPRSAFNIAGGNPVR